MGQQSQLTTLCTLCYQDQYLIYDIKAYINLYRFPHWFVHVQYFGILIHAQLVAPFILINIRVLPYVELYISCSMLSESLDCLVGWAAATGRAQDTTHLKGSRFCARELSTRSRIVKNKLIELNIKTIKIGFNFNIWLSEGIQEFCLVTLWI